MAWPEARCARRLLSHQRALRGRTAPDLHRPLRVPGLPILAPLAFVLATLMLFWARWPHTGQIMLLLILPLPVYLYYQAKGEWRDFARQLNASWWLLAYLIAITVLWWTWHCRLVYRVVKSVVAEEKK